MPSIAKSTKSRRSGNSQKTEKPYPEFPLTPHHHSGRWCKKRKGTFYYFGPTLDPDVENPDEAYEAAWKAVYEKYKREWPYIRPGLDSALVALDVHVEANYHP